LIDRFFSVKVTFEPREPKKTVQLKPFPKKTPCPDGTHYI
jgi:hypothetical protein